MDERIIPIVAPEDKPRPYGAAPRLMVSYAHKDEKWVVPHVKKLNRDYFYDIWIDYDDIRVGRNWREEIARGITNADAVIFFLSAQSASSEVCREELRTARELKKHIFAVLIEKFDFSKALTELGFPDGSDTQIILQFVEQGDDAGYAKLLAELERYEDAHGKCPLQVSWRTKKLAGDPELAKLHQEYLRMVIYQRLDVVSLVDQFKETPRDQVSLSEVYVPLKYDISFNYEVVDGEYRDWHLRDVSQAAKPTEKPKDLNGFAPTHAKAFKHGNSSCVKRGMPTNANMMKKKLRKPKINVNR